MMVSWSGVRQVSRFLLCGFGGFRRAVLEAEAVVGLEPPAYKKRTPAPGIAPLPRHDANGAFAGSPAGIGAQRIGPSRAGRWFGHFGSERAWFRISQPIRRRLQDPVPRAAFGNAPPRRRRTLSYWVTATSTAAICNGRFTSILLKNSNFHLDHKFRGPLAVSMEISSGAQRSDRYFCVRPSLRPC